MGHVTRLKTPRVPQRQPDAQLIGILNEMINMQLSPDQIERLANRELSNKNFKMILPSLIEGFATGGNEEFWRRYDSWTKSFPVLNDWRDEIEIPTVENEEDIRFRTGKNGKKVLKLSYIEDIYALPDAEYLVSKILETGTVSLLYGKSGTGKTFTALHLALCVAHGINWHDRPVRQGRVWYINTEGGRQIKKRFQAFYKEHSNLVETNNMQIIPWALNIKEHFQILIDTFEAEEEKPILLVVDNFSMVCNVDQNSQNEVAECLARFHEIAERYGTHVMVIHHTTKEGAFNGSMAFRNHVDTMIELKKEDKNSPILFTSQKARDDDEFADIRTELKQVPLYYRETTGELITSCVVTECTTEDTSSSLTDQHKDTMVGVLTQKGRITSNQWKKFSHLQGVPVRKFDVYAEELLQSGTVINDGPKPTGHSIYWQIKE